MRREKSLRIGVHHANAVVWGPVYRTHLTRLDAELVDEVRHASNEHARLSLPGPREDLHRRRDRGQDGRALLVVHPLEVALVPSLRRRRRSQRLLSRRRSSNRRRLMLRRDRDLRRPPREVRGRARARGDSGPLPNPSRLPALVVTPRARAAARRRRRAERRSREAPPARDRREICASSRVRSERGDAARDARAHDGNDSSRAMTRSPTARVASRGRDVGRAGGSREHRRAIVRVGASRVF